MNLIKKGIFFLMIFVITISCSSKKTVYHSAETKFIKKDGKDVIVLSSTGFGKNKKSALINAEKNAFKIILFKGLPNSELYNPLIKNEEKATQENKSFFNRFFNEGIYRNYITSSKEDTTYTQDKKSGLIKTTVKIGINIHSLRVKLEQNGIIKKFGL